MELKRNLYDHFKMRILVIADEWQYIPTEYAPVDLILSTGDVPDEKILEIASKAECRNIFAVKGNHDTPALFTPPIIDLHLNVRNFKGYTFGGFNGCWRYKPRGYFLYEQPEVSAQLSSFPCVDVFVAHNSPITINERDQDVHQGFDAFRDYIITCAPRYLIHGHQHINATTNLGETQVIGAYGIKVVDT